MSQQNKAVVRRLIEDHWNAKNAALVTELYAPSVTLHTSDGVLKGLEGASFLLDAYTKAFPDFRQIIHDVTAEGNLVVARCTFTGTHQGPLGEIPATGKRVSVDVIFSFRLTAGKVDEGHFVWDRYGFRQQLGVLPASG